jgi:hypothetical protein
MTIGPSAEEQEANELEKQKELARERVARREQLGQAPQPEPVLDGDNDEE